MSWWDDLLAQTQQNPAAQPMPGSPPGMPPQPAGWGDQTVSPADASRSTQIVTPAEQSLSTQTPANMAATAAPPAPGAGDMPSPSMPAYHWQQQGQAPAYQPPQTMATRPAIPPQAMAHALRQPMRGMGGGMLQGYLR